MEQLLLEYQNILLRQYALSDDRLYSINKALKIFNREQANQKTWKTPTTHFRQRKVLTKKENMRLYQIRQSLLDLPCSPSLLYYIVSLSLAVDN